MTELALDNNKFPKIWTAEELNILKENYENMNTIELCKLLKHRNKNAIILKASRLGLKKVNKITGTNRKYFCNFDYFNKINTSNKAYYLGWAFTDGNISGSNYRIRLHERDKNILEKFSKDINSTYKLYKFKDCYELNITNKELTYDLIKLGCTPRKTFTIEFPKINEEYCFDFIKGAFDGDGSYVCTEKTKKICLTSGSYNFIKRIQEILFENNIKSYLWTAKTYSTLEISGKKNLNKFLTLILNTNSDFLDRKKEKMLKLYKYSISQRRNPPKKIGQHRGN